MGWSSLRGRIGTGSCKELRAHGNAPASQADSMGLHGAQGWSQLTLPPWLSGSLCNSASHQQGPLPVPWGQGQCGPPLNSPCGKEAPNTEHVKPVGHRHSTPRPLASHPAHQPYPFFRYTARRVPFPAPHFHLTLKTSKAGGLRGPQIRLHSEDGKKLH